MFTIWGSVCESPYSWSHFVPVILTGLHLGTVAVLLLKGMDQLSLRPSPHLETANQIQQPSTAH